MTMSAGVRPTPADREEAAAAPSGRSGPSRMHSAVRALRNATANWPGVLAALLVWELLPRVGILPPDNIPPASEVLPRFAGLLDDASFWSNVGSTLQGWAIGLGISILLATPLGLLIGSNAYLDRATRATVEFLRPVPSVALLPLAILVLGISMDMKIFLVAFATFWPILVQAIYGVQDVDPVARDTARSFGVGRLAIFFRVTLPSAAPYLATGLRVASALGIILAITAELVAGVPGLGQAILLAQSGGAYDLMYALILATGLISLGLSAVLRRAERYALRWHVSHREVTSA